jgi:hypothetical protein
MKPAVDNISIAEIRKPHMSRALVETTLNFFDHKDVHDECLEHGQTRGSGSVLNCGKHLESYRNCYYINI